MGGRRNLPRNNYRNSATRVVSSDPERERISYELLAVNTVNYDADGEGPIRLGGINSPLSFRT